MSIQVLHKYQVTTIVSSNYKIIQELHDYPGPTGVFKNDKSIQELQEFPGITEVFMKYPRTTGVSRYYKSI